ncbi:MAG TPA: DUF5996 family protein, partial [Caulobacteraceae bacterium]
MSAHPEWPELDYASWKETRDTLHLWTQVAGKVRLALAPPVNHWWHVPLYVSSRGLTTSAMPYGDRCFELLFDFVADRLRVVCSDGTERDVELRPRTTADFYRAVMQAMRELGIEVGIRTMPSEIADAVPLDQDERPGTYDGEAARRFWRALVQVERVFTQHRGRFLGKASPAHFFWGSFDLAVTRFSGRRAPEHPGAPGLPDSVTREAYSHEVSSAGFWPGGEGMEQAIFYSYAYPGPAGFADAPVGPAGAAFDGTLGEFVLPYDVVRN